MKIRRSYVSFPIDVDSMTRRISELERRINQMAGELTALTAKVNEVVSTTENLILLSNQQAAMIKDLQAGQVDLTPVVNATATLAELKSKMDEAITANTPAPPAP